MNLYCAGCGTDTGFYTDTPLELRESTYIESIGQLCENCHRQLSGEAEKIGRLMAAAEAKRYNLTPLDPDKPIEKAGCPDCFTLVSAIGLLLDFMVFKCEKCNKLFRKEDEA